MSQQLFSRYPADVVEHGKLGAHLGPLMPPLAALLYPFLLEAFHANIAPVISGQSAEPALRQLPLRCSCCWPSPRLSWRCLAR